MNIHGGGTRVLNEGDASSPATLASLSAATSCCSLTENSTSGSSGTGELRGDSSSEDASGHSRYQKMCELHVCVGAGTNSAHRRHRCRRRCTPIND
jgi:hypothetical protein